MLYCEHERDSVSVVLIGAESSCGSISTIAILGGKEDGSELEDLNEFDDEDDQAGHNDEEGGEASAFVVKLDAFLDSEESAYWEDIDGLKHDCLFIVMINYYYNEDNNYI